MELERDGRSRKRLVWGFFLIALGSAFLLDRFGAIDLPNIGRLWPLIFVVIAASHLAEGRPGSAITLLFTGAWLMACNEGWMGLDYGNSWPLLLVAIGIGIVIRALTREDARKRRTGGVS